MRAGRPRRMSRSMQACSRQSTRQPLHAGSRARPSWRAPRARRSKAKADQIGRCLAGSFPVQRDKDIGIAGDGRESAMNTWTVAAAKAKFSEVIELARSRGPQTITLTGRTAAVLVAA